MRSRDSTERFAPSPKLVGIGSHGTDYSIDRGENWTKIGTWAAKLAERPHGVAVGSDSRIARLSLDGI